MKDSILSLENISFSYGEKKVLENVHLTLPRGDFLGLVGPNGGGKTTLIKIMLGLLKPDQGSVKLLNESISSFKQWNRIGYVSQKANTFNKGFPATVYEVVSMGLTAKIGYLRFMREEDKKKVHQAIKEVGMEEYTHENIGNLSGGQQQRIFIARAIVGEPDLLILDEPTVGVDYQNVERFYDLLHQLNTEKKLTLLLVTHDTGAMTKHATNVACLNKTLHFHGGTKEYTSLTDKDLAKIYGHPVQVVVHDHD